MRLRAVRILTVVCLAALSVSCFEPPVAESLLLEFLPEGLVTVTARVRIRDLDEPNAALARRIEETRRAMLAGEDAWSRRFEALGGAVERGDWEKHEGRLVSASHGATTDDPAALERFFSDTGVAVSWRREEGRAELALYPPPSGNGTRQDRQRVSRALASWSATIAVYVARTGELWRYLDRHPDRGRACLAHLLSAYVTEDEVAAAGELSAEESPLVDSVNDAMSEVTKVLQVSPGEAYSLDEVSRQVYDPFPAPIEIALAGEILESEGFSAGPDGRLRAGGTSLWQALATLEGRWLTPDPVVAIVAHDLQAPPERSFDLGAFLARPRRADPADARAIRQALTAALAPATGYRVAWTEAPPTR